MNCSTVDSGFGESDFHLTARGLLANATRCVVDRATVLRCGGAIFGSPGVFLVVCGDFTVCTACEVLGCSGRTVMTRGADTTSARVVPGAWPGSVVPGASSVVSQQSRLSDFLGSRDFSEIFASGGAENTKSGRCTPWFGHLFLD